MTELSKIIEIETAPNPDFAVILMHGLGADANDFVPAVPELGLPELAAVRFVFPNAPSIPVTVNGGYIMPAWYDIVSMDGESRQVDEAGIQRTVGAIRSLIARENARGIPSSRIVVAGFSQGGAMAYTVGLTHPEPLAGIIALSAYIPAPTLIDSAHVGYKLPIFGGHGDEDDVVLLSMGRRARDYAEQKGHAVEWHEYEMPHSVCLEELADIGHWLSRLL